jgi:hypothetical protein
MRLVDAPLVAMTGLTSGDVANWMGKAGIDGLEKEMTTRAELWGAEFQLVLDERVNVLLDKISLFNSAEARTDYLKSGDFSQFMKENFSDLGNVEPVIAAIQVLISSSAAMPMISGKQMIALEFAAPARTRIRAKIADLNSMSLQLVKDNPQLGLGVITNHSGPDSAMVLNMLQLLALERLVVLHRKEQPLGRAFNIAPLTSLVYDPNNPKKSAEAQVKRALIAGSDGKLIALWTEDMRIGKMGIYTVVAELGRVADPDLKALACAAIRYIFLKYASLDKAGQEMLMANPDMILVDLNKMGFGSAIQIKGNTLVFDMQALADSFTARQSIDQAA